MKYTVFGTISLNDISKWYSSIKIMIKNDRKFQIIIENKMMITPVSTNEATILDKKTVETITEVTNNMKRICHYLTSDRDIFSDRNMKIILRN
ncbi:Hypothetical protein CINCED_3A014276 [Cinara cedri]|uniref:Uncharacterized protein n=1 Tax=Cinara cedri TaxID=506608 RepID=A0A5E4NJW0_9HEMI|nr:Hypothetical protein CINCED_3A014276 [Cinara cedri]